MIKKSRNTAPSQKLQLLLFFLFVSPSNAQAASQAINAEGSTLKVHVDRSGVFSFVGHNHVILAPIARGQVEPSGDPSVELWVKSGQLKVKDPDLTADKRAEVQKTMEGPAVLDVQRFPEIHFRSTAVKATGANHWTVLGNLDLHGRTQPVTVEVSEDKGRYRGSASFNQTDFGILPVSVAGGTVKVKDNVKMEFDIVLSP